MKHIWTKIIWRKKNIDARIGFKVQLLRTQPCTGARTQILVGMVFQVTYYMEPYVKDLDTILAATLDKKRRPCVLVFRAIADHGSVCLFKPLFLRSATSPSLCASSESQWAHWGRGLYFYLEVTRSMVRNHFVTSAVLLWLCELGAKWTIVNTFVHTRT